MATIGQNLTLVVSDIGRDVHGRYWYRDIYEGTREACEETRLSIPLGFAYQTDYRDAPRCVIEISSPQPDNNSNDVLSYNWEIGASRVAKDILDHPIAKGLPDAAIDAIREVTEISSPDWDTYTEKVTKVTDAAGDSSANALLILKYKLRNINFFDSLYSIRLNQYVGQNYSVQVSDVDVNQVYSTADVINEARVNNTPIPARLQYKLVNIPAQSKNGYTWGWLKRPSPETQETGGRIRITTEWDLDLWPDDIY